MAGGKSGGGAPLECICTHIYTVYIYTSIKIIKNEVGCRDDAMPKTGDTRRHCEVELTVCNNLPQPPSLHLVFWGLRKIVAYC